jgi:lipopolysaccharide transport system ATP-binding protein
VGSLLEVGTGFHPELTGRENVYLNGVILGMKRAEVEKKFDEIVAFSEVEKFIDTPVKRYSSGMKVRLAFAVAAHLEPEILLVDEVLAVGDGAFQKKCLGKMQDVASAGRTVLFVSHNMAAINNLCSAGIVIDTGGITFQGQASEAVQFYLGRLNEQYTDTRRDGSIYFPVDDTKEIQIRQVSVMDETGKVGSVFGYHETVFLSILFRLAVPNPDYYAVVFVQDIYGNMVFFTADDDLTESAMARLSSGIYRYRVELPNSLLKPGQYYVTVSLTQRHKTGGPQDRRDSVLAFEIIDNHTRRATRNGYRKPALVAPEIHWSLEPAEPLLPEV